MTFFEKSKKVENLSGFNIYKKTLWLILALFTVFNAIRLVYFSPADTNELAVYVQTPPDFQDEINKIVSDCGKENDKECVFLNLSNQAFSNSIPV